MSIRHLWSGLLCTALLFGAQQSQAKDHVFDATFSERPEGPHSDAEAARFLTQATFGPNYAEIRRLREMGYNAWFNEQFAEPSTTHLPYLLAQEALGLDIYQNARQEAWWDRALTADDQLRQRVAYALSQLLVVSDQAGAIDGPKQLAHYYDMLLNHSFGNYRVLLEDVTLSPVMGNYLSMFKNRKPDPVENIRPDENYAREIMQLFSIGLVRLNIDGTPLTQGGAPIPTYTQDTIRGFAHVFTGWNWADCPRTGGGQTWEWEWCPIGPVPWPQPGWDAGWFQPMEEWEQYHASEGTKQLLIYPGVGLPGGVLPAGGTARSNLETALDNVFWHPNVGPFLARHLIQRLVSSNPSPAYIQRVAQTFNNNGSGVRGDLRAVVRAVLMDSEARNLPTLASNRGKMREPMMRMVHLYRVFGSAAPDGRWREWNPEYNFSQAPLRSPTVFNFYLPHYQPTGELTDLGLVAPEFQISTDTFIARTQGTLGGRVYYAYTGNPWSGPEDIVTDLGPDEVYATNPVRLVDRYDLLFMNRTMSNEMFDLLVGYLETIQTDNPLRRRIQDAVWLIQSSPEYVIER